MEAATEIGGCFRWREEWKRFMIRLEIRGGGILYCIWETMSWRFLIETPASSIEDAKKTRNLPQIHSPSSFSSNTILLFFSMEASINVPFLLGNCPLLF